MINRARQNREDRIAAGQAARLTISQQGDVATRATAISSVHADTHSAPAPAHNKV